MLSMQCAIKRRRDQTTRISPPGLLSRALDVYAAPLTPATWSFPVFMRPVFDATALISQSATVWRSCGDSSRGHAFPSDSHSVTST
jgi:hypothetical protein